MCGRVARDTARGAAKFRHFSCSLAPPRQSAITTLEGFTGYMSSASYHLVAGRLALDFANLSPASRDLSWQEFVSFLVDARLVSDDRAARLRPLLSTEPQAVDAVLHASSAFVNPSAPSSPRSWTKSPSPPPGPNPSTKSSASRKA